MGKKMGASRKQGVAVSIDDMPPEVMLEIFASMDPSTLLVACAVSVQWNKMIEQYDSQLWKQHLVRKWAIRELVLCGPSWKKAWMNANNKQVRKVQMLMHNSVDTIQPSMSDLSISVLPAKLFSFQTIRRLYLYENKLTTLPPQITQLTSLRLLSLFRNNFSHIPHCVLQLTQLEGLWMYDNQVSSIPPQISRLTNLQFLHLSNNKISSVPTQISALTNLENLYLSNNQISELPEELFQLTNLQTLLLNKNKLLDISPSITQLQKLNKLDLTQNNITSLPYNLESLPQLTCLHYDMDGDKIPMMTDELGVHAVDFAIPSFFQRK